ncbi:SPOR domain-containing protein [Aurantiacibacter suaedae]|uniref:SPOR domain-containing protein n=1 Tax=Aurantiacibacter suaedae TaxID=2545755 RepID=UPI0010F96550|nr:SPOR domain-containing protein [Aurantiacibacter suaedae]
MQSGGDDRNRDGVLDHSGNGVDENADARVIGQDQLPEQSLGRADDHDDMPEEPLMLADMDERLPWLESDDDKDEGGVDVGRLVALAVVALAALLGLLALLWFLSRPADDAELQPQGSTIEAPEEPYRTAPADPGGTEVAGTGDMSFEVGEGQSRDSQLATDDLPAPSIDRTQAEPSAAPTPSPTPSASATPSSASGVPVQVAAYSSRARAEQGWNEVRGRYEALSGLNHRIEEAVVDGATVYRLQAMAGSAAAADQVCRSVRAAGGDCQVKR